MMKKLLLLALVLLNVLSVSSTSTQQKTDQNLLSKVTKHNYSSHEIPLDQYNSLKRTKANIGKNGKTHTKFEQVYKGIVVDNLTVILHKIGDELSWTGKIIPEMDIKINPALQENEAKQLAIAAANVKHPIWEIEAYENLKRKTENNPAATNKPQGELVIYDGNYSHDAAQYRLAYKFQIFSVNPLSHKTIYVDANTGIILGNRENTHNCSETCNAKTVNGPTNYSGDVEFDVCCDDSGCYLESSNGCDIITYDAKESYGSPQNCITDSNGSFDDPTANEVFWATQQYCKFLSDVFDRKGIDDDDHPLIAYVHYGEDHNNAYWWNNAAYFGDGDGEYASSWTSIDIVAHEFTHGLNDYTAKLVYENESGALDESFADIFGLLLEQYINGETDWLIGNDFMIEYSALRNFINPKDPTLRRRYPNTYLGEDYYLGDGDNGGVHRNSSVQNHWFYLLSEGGSGINDNDYTYNIEGIGIENAAQIVFENLTNYLTENSQFMDARKGAIQAAEDLFGEDSFEAKQTEKAWCAVGVGECIVEPLTCRAIDSLALRALYFATDGENWTNKWDLNKSMDTWYGVQLNENGCVTHIDLDGEVNWSWSESEFGGNNLTGSIPAELSSLNFLVKLNLANNQLTGSIPKELGELSNLLTLDLHSNQLTGNIPPEIGNLNKLVWLLLYDNQLSGNIPAELDNLDSLFHLSLGTNLLSGNIPPQLGNMNNLNELFLNKNQLSGNIPAELGNLNELVILDLNNNELSGSIPSSICNLSNLEFLYMCCNQLSGTIPAKIGNLNSLKRLVLAANQLSGNIPAEISYLNTLTHLFLSSNQLNGNIPSGIGNLDGLTFINLSYNQLSGCYDENLNNFCTQLTGEFWGSVSNISEGNNLNASWEEFCATGAGSCDPPICNSISDRNALIALYKSTNGANWTIPWDTLQPMDTWYGITLNENGCVICIDLDGEDNCAWSGNAGGNNLTGNIPLELGDLSNLIVLNLRENKLTGNIPTELGELTKLTYLDVSFNQLEGNIPTQLGSLTNLKYLILSENQLTGSIPVELGKLSNLIGLSLGNNQLSGEIPVELGKLSKLEELYLGVTQITGSIPISLGNLNNLTGLHLCCNNLSGGIPTELSKLKNLTKLVLSGNQLSGSIPVELSYITNLTHFACGYNQLSGSIPGEFGNLPNLIYFDTHYNQLTGCYNANLNKLCSQLTGELWGNYSNISEGNNFDSSWEDFCATEAGACDSVITQCHIDDWTSLKALYESTDGNNWTINTGWNTQIANKNSPPNGCNLSELYGVELNEYGRVKCIDLDGEDNCDFSHESIGINLIGTIPPELGNLSNLSFLNLADNQLMGSIPIELGNLSSLRVLDLHSNQLNGSIPYQLGNLKNLEALALYHNELSGEIPEQIGNLSKLRHLSIHSNKFSGSIPSELGSLSNLDYLALFGNELTGVIPISLGNLNKLELLNLSHNQLSGSIPPELGNLEKLVYLFLGNNQLNGNIPPQLGSLSNLVSLTLNRNQLIGIIPSELGNLSELISLDLNENKLTGNIPTSFGNLDKLTILYLCCNQLSGNIPVELGNLNKLNHLALNSNQLNGSIPMEISYLSNLTHLVLSGNQLSGIIPNKLGNLNNLTYLNLSYNQLSGCYGANLKKFCTQLTGELWGYPPNISDGNDFNVSWEEFCAKNTGICEDSFVLPGDFDNDGCLSYTDVLYWGLGEGNTGPVRENASNEFFPQLAEDWEGDVNGINSKHQDANGDGIVNKGDLYVFVDNYAVEDNRCNKNNTRVSEDHLSYVRVEKVSNVSFEETETSEITYELYVDSKIENMDVGLHGIELEFQLKGFGNILNVDLDASPFNAKVDTVTSLMKKNGKFIYKCAITRTDNGTTICNKDKAAAILVVTIENIPTAEEREVKEFLSTGSFTVAGSGAIPLPLQGASTFVSTETDFSVNVVPSPSKGIVEVIVNKNNEIIRYIYESAPGAEPCDVLYSQEFDITDCSLNVSDGCSINSTIPIEPGNCIIDDVELYNLLPIQLHPNPTNSKISFTLNSEYCGRQIDKIEIFDVAGYLVKKTEMYNSNVCTYNIDVNELSNGIYFINIFNGDSILKGKFMKL